MVYICHRCHTFFDLSSLLIRNWKFVNRLWKPVLKSVNYLELERQRIDHERRSASNFRSLPQRRRKNLKSIEDIKEEIQTKEMRRLLRNFREKFVGINLQISGYVLTFLIRKAPTQISFTNSDRRTGRPWPRRIRRKSRPRFRQSYHRFDKAETPVDYFSYFRKVQFDQKTVTKTSWPGKAKRRDGRARKATKKK